MYQLILVFLTGVIATLAVGGLVVWGVNERRGRLQVQSELANLKREIAEAKVRRLSYDDVHDLENVAANGAALLTLLDQDREVLMTLLASIAKVHDRGLKGRK